MSDGDWRHWAEQVAEIASAGLMHTSNPYDRDRFERLARLAAAMHNGRSSGSVGRLELASAVTTPKSDVRGAAFRDGWILMVREVADHDRWTLPGGWADVGVSPAENAVKELREETGFETRVVKLAAVFDRSRQGHPAAPFEAYKHFFICEIVGGVATPSDETSEVGFFAEDALPADLSVDRTTLAELRLMFTHWRNPERPTDFD